MSTSLSDPPVELSIVKSVSTTTAAPVRMTSHSASASREDSIQLCKETSFALQMTLSPGTAILGLMDLPTNPTPVLRKLIDSYSTASVPMPLAKEQIQHLNSEMQNSKKRGDKGARRGSLLNPGARRFSLSMATEASVPIGGPIHELTGSQISFFSAHNKPLKPIRPLTLNERISQAQPKIPTIKRPIITIDPFAEKERLEQEARVNAVIELLEEKRTQYHEQEKEAIHKHLQKSRARLYELEKALTASRQRQEVDKERSRKSKLESLPEHLINGAHNNFVVSPDLKTPVYDAVAEKYMAKRSSRTVKAKKAMEMHLINNTTERKASLYHQVKVVEEENAFGLKGLPPLYSLDYPISLSEDSTSYVDCILQKQNPPEKKAMNSRKSKIDRMSEQLIRNKHLAAIGLRKMNEGEKGSGARLPSQLRRRETEEFIPVNIVDDDELEVDKEGKIVHRWKAGLTKQNTTFGGADFLGVDNKKEISIQITPARKSADSRRSFVGVRHSFVLPRTGEEVSLPEQDSKESSLRCLTASRSFTEAQQRSVSPSASGSRRASSVSSNASPRDSIAIKRMESTRASDTSSIHPDEIDGENDWILKGISTKLTQSPEKSSRLFSARDQSKDTRDAMQCEPSEHGISEHEGETATDAALPVSETNESDGPELLSNDSSAPTNESPTVQQIEEQELEKPRPARRIYEPLTMDELLASEPQLKITQTEKAFISKWRHGLQL